MIDLRLQIVRVVITKPFCEKCADNASGSAD
jgi:hypothetical protein